LNRLFAITQDCAVFLSATKAAHADRPQRGDRGNGMKGREILIGQVSCVCVPKKFTMKPNGKWQDSQTAGRRV